jgi:UDP-glucuronate 4-epimerase
MKVIVTGIAGFVGYHTGRALLAAGHSVVGVDNLNPYYSVQLKRDRLQELGRLRPFEFHEMDVSDASALSALFARHADTTHVVHLAAQAGVRYSVEQPAAYVQANVLGQVSVLEAARKLKKAEHVVYASSSSVYGANKQVPFSPEHRVTSPMSVYAATKLAAEHIAEVYAHLYGMPSTGLRLFTVYGPWGRPDMAAYKFAAQIMAGESIAVHNNGDMARDFTYIDDVVEGLMLALGKLPQPNETGARHRIYNIGNHHPTPLLRFIAVLEEALGRRANLRLVPMQPGEVKETFADIEASSRDLGFHPRTPIEEGIPRFVAWYNAYHGAR